MRLRVPTSPRRIAAAVLAGLALGALPSVVGAQAESSLAGSVVTQGGNPVPGALVELVQSDAPVGSVVTGPDGIFSFEGLASGDYELRQAAPGIDSLIIEQTSQAATVGTAGGVASLANGDRVTAIALPESTDANGYVFFDSAVARISGTAYDDLNRNDQRDPDEPLLSDAPVLVSDGDPANDETLTTGPDGIFEVIVVPGTTYSLEPIETATHRPGVLADPQPAGTVSGGVVQGIVLNEREVIDGFEFGFQPIDTVLPDAPVIETPEFDGDVGPNPRQFMGTATDDVSVASVLIQIEDTATGLFLQADGQTFAAPAFDLTVAVDTPDAIESTWSYTAPTLPEGSYRIGVVTVDGEGNLSGRSNRLFVVDDPDTTAPEVQITQPVDGAVTGTSLIVAGTAADDEDLALVELEIQNLDTGEYWTGTEWVTDESRFELFGLETWSYELDIVPGEYRITAFATDTSGNVADATVGITRLFPVDWSRDPGVAGEIDDLIPSTQLNVTDFGAIPDDGLNDKPAFVAAIREARDLGGAEIVVPAGQFDVHANIKVRQDNTVITGAGPDLTTVNFVTNSGIGFEFGGRFPFASPGVDPSTSNAQTASVVSAELGSKTLVVDDAINFAPGSLALLTTTLDTPRPSSLAGQTVKVLTVETADPADGGLTTLTVEDALTDDYSSFIISTFDPATDSGIQNLSITTAPDTRVVDLVLFRGTDNAFYRNVHSRDPLKSHVLTRYSYHCEIRDSVFDDAIDHGGGGRGYGANIANRTSGCLIENNRFRYLRHSMLLQDGATGNVVARNYSEDPRHPDFTNGGPSDISFHSYSVANLVEGNVVNRIHMNDAGVPGPFNTLLRNCVVSGPITLQGNTANETIVGNATYGTDDALRATVMPPILFGNRLNESPRNYLEQGQTLFDTDGVILLDPSPGLTLHQNWRAGTRFGTSVFGAQIPDSLYGSTAATLLDAPTGDPVADCQIDAGGPTLDDVDVRFVVPRRAQDPSLTPLTLRAEVVTDAGAAEARLTVQNNDTGEWLQPNGTFGPTEETVTIPVDYAAATATVELVLGEALSGEYTVSARGVDVNGVVQSDAREMTFNVDAPVVLTSPVLNESFPSQLDVEGRVNLLEGASRVRIFVLTDDDPVRYLQDDGVSFGLYEFIEFDVDSPGEVSSTFDYRSPPLPAGNYKLITIAIDEDGFQHPADFVDFTIG